MLWCECNRCDGGKSVSRATWFRHQKRVYTSRERSHINGVLPARENHAASSRTIDVDGTNTSEDRGTLDNDNDNDAARSDFVGVYNLISTIC
jgi:hypothetical protein